MVAKDMMLIGTVDNLAEKLNGVVESRGPTRQRAERSISKMSISSQLGVSSMFVDDGFIHLKAVISDGLTVNRMRSRLTPETC